MATDSINITDCWPLTPRQHKIGDHLSYKHQNPAATDPIYQNNNLTMTDCVEKWAWRPLTIHHPNKTPEQYSADMGNQISPNPNT